MIIIFFILNLSLFNQPHSTIVRKPCSRILSVNKPNLNTIEIDSLIQLAISSNNTKVLSKVLHNEILLEIKELGIIIDSLHSIYSAEKSVINSEHYEKGIKITVESEIFQPHQMIITLNEESKIQIVVFSNPRLNKLSTIILPKILDRIYKYEYSLIYPPDSTAHSLTKRIEYLTNLDSAVLKGLQSENKLSRVFSNTLIETFKQSNGNIDLSPIAIKSNCEECRTIKLSFDIIELLHKGKIIKARKKFNKIPLQESYKYEFVKNQITKLIKSIDDKDYSILMIKFDIAVKKN